MKIPIKYAIESGAWLHCIDGADETYDDFQFRVKLLSFEKLHLNPENINQAAYNLEEGDFWLLELQLVNAGKVSLEKKVLNYTIIVDHDECEYPPVHDPDSVVSSKSFNGVSFFRPKIKYTGALAFYLPKEDEADYYVSVTSGNIQEV